MSNANKPAFPGSYTGNNGMPVWSDGMTLRDYFAAKAFQSRLAKHNDWTLTELAEQAYGDADAMLAAREQEVRAIAHIEALEAENAALRAMNADVDVGINNWIDHIEKHGASGAAIQAMRNLLEMAKPVTIGKVMEDNDNAG